MAATFHRAPPLPDPTPFDLGALRFDTEPWPPDGWPSEDRSLQVSAPDRVPDDWTLATHDTADDSGLTAARRAAATCLHQLQALTAPRDGAAQPNMAAGERERLSELATLIRTLEELTCTTRAAQAALAVRLDAGTRTREAARKVPAARQGKSVAHELALARRTSPWWGRTYLGLAKLLPAELPHTWEAFRTGHITEKTALAIAQETAAITVDARHEIDRLLAADPTALEQMSEKQVRRAAAAHAARLDNTGIAARRRRAVGARHVTITPAPDAMSRLTLTVPVEQGVAAYATLKKHAATLIGTPDAEGRGRGALMADAAITRITGHTEADRVPVRINLVITHADLFGHDTTAAAATDDSAADPRSGAGPRITEPGIGTFGLDPTTARDLIARALDTDTGAWLRRLYAHPTSGQLIAMDSRSRQVPTALAAFITLRDQTCSTRWCDAPVRHIDHITPVIDDGKTVAINLQGLCEDCNHAKQAPGWHQHATTGLDGIPCVATTTPAGQHHTTSPPPAA
ncbi:HNH endonuclease [Nocardioides daejeonensis]|uniref:HNH endonuclease n=1 Tax=Nocardioides daejeonensis TaxID=1046556 RepID=UPI000D746271|nr:DUF222 domain-containing protein [Nocardioides daejeonensis]